MHCAFAGACCWAGGKKTCGLQGAEVLYVRNWRNDVDLFPHADIKFDVSVYGHSILCNI